MQTLTYSPDSTQACVTKGNNATATLLAAAGRWLDDITHRHALTVAKRLGGDPARILEAGYGLSTPAFARTLRSGGLFTGAMPHGTVILPCRNGVGEIVAFHTTTFQWIASDPASHVVNAIRARFAEIKLCNTTSEADTIALSENVCAVARNGCSDRMVQAAILSALRLNNPHNPHTIKRPGAVQRLARAA